MRGELLQVIAQSRRSDPPGHCPPDGSPLAADSRLPSRFEVKTTVRTISHPLNPSHESGSPPGDVPLALRHLPDAQRLVVLDRGAGMNEAVLANGLLPFCSNGRNGSG